MRESSKCRRVSTKLVNGEENVLNRPLHYAIRALVRSLPKSPDQTEILADVRGLLKEIEAYIDLPDRDEGSHIRRTIAPLQDYIERPNQESKQS
jgi:hypothetical protein